MNKWLILFLASILLALSCISGVKAETEQLDKQTIRRITWSPDGTRLAITDYTPTIEIWDVTTEQEILDLTGQDGYAYTLAWSPDSQRLASSSSEQSGIDIWDVSTGQLMISINEVPNIFTLIWLDKNKILAGEEGNHGLHVWDSTTGKLIQSYEDVSAGGEAVLSPNGQTLAAIPADNVMILDVNAFKNTIVLSLVSDFAQDYQAWQLDWSPINDTLAVGYMNGRVRIWDTEKATVIEELQANESQPNIGWPVLSGLQDVTYSSDGQLLYGVSTDGTIRGWQVSDGHAFFDAHFDDTIYDASWSPDRTTLAIGTKPHPNDTTSSAINEKTWRDGSLHLIQYDELAVHTP